MDVTLMPHIKDEPVSCKIEYIMKCHGQFHRSQVRTQMSPGHTDLFDQELPNLLRQFPIV